MAVDLEVCDLDAPGRLIPATLIAAARPSGEMLRYCVDDANMAARFHGWGGSLFYDALASTVAGRFERIRVEPSAEALERQRVALDTVSASYREDLRPVLDPGAMTCQVKAEQRRREDALIADYASVELRLLAHASEPPGVLDGADWKWWFYGF